MMYIGALISSGRSLIFHIRFYCLKVIASFIKVVVMWWISGALIVAVFRGGMKGLEWAFIVVGGKGYY